MSDIVARLQHTHIPCTCFVRNADYMQHSEHCTHRVVREAEVEILRLKAELEIVQILGEYVP